MLSLKKLPKRDAAVNVQSTGKLPGKTQLSKSLLPFKTDLPRLTVLCIEKTLSQSLLSCRAATGKASWELETLSSSLEMAQTYSWTHHVGKSLESSVESSIDACKHYEQETARI